MAFKNNIHLYGNIKIEENVMSSLNLSISNIKGIHGKIEIPLKNGVYGIVGSNGSGKSTIMSTLSKLVPPYSFRLSENDYDSNSTISYEVSNKSNTWNFANGRVKKSNKNEAIRFYGRYEGSLFYGTRFEDSKIVDTLMLDGSIKDDLIVSADEYVIKSLGKILHDNEAYYKNLKRLKNRDIAKNLNIKNLPYFYDFNGKLISQYKMSSGECLLISLLHFLYNSIIRKSIPVEDYALLLIDEIELALHPIAVKRLIEMIQNIAEESPNLICIISSHSLEVIRTIPPENLFNLKIESNNNYKYFYVDNPIYPCYLMKDIYFHNGYDFVILVEDDLSAMIIENSLRKFKLRQNKLINVVPTGGWSNIFDLHKTFVKENTLGISTQIISIIDGDVKSDADKKFKNLPHLFLPVPSVEKFLLTHLVNETNSKVKKSIKDVIFTGVTSIEFFVQQYLDEENERRQNNKDYKGDNDGKALYRKLKHFCQNERKISKDALIDILFQIIDQNINLSDFENSLCNLIN